MHVRAAVLRGFGQAFSVEDVNLPDPGPGSVVVDVRAVGVCGRDVVVWRGGFRGLKPPLILGHEVFGIHDGRPVGVYPGIVGSECMTGGGCFDVASCSDYRILGEGLPGGYATRVAVPEWNLVDLPDEDYARYAAAVCGVATYIHASRVAGIEEGSRVLVVGASGGVGIHGVQYLTRVLGARVIGYTRSPEKARVLRELGVEATSDPLGYRSLGRVDYVLDNVGAPTVNWSMRWLKPGGMLVLVGNVTGEPVVLERPALVVMREYRITGSAAYNKREYTEAVRLVGEGVVQAFYRAYRLEDVNKAYSDVTRGRVLGRAVLLV